jgi:hypothetical protein
MYDLCTLLETATSCQTARYVEFRITILAGSEVCLFVVKRKLKVCRSQVSSGSIVSDYGLDDMAIGVRIPAGVKDFSSSLCVQTGSGAHPASCTMGTGGSFHGGKSAAGA